LRLWGLNLKTSRHFQLESAEQTAPMRFLAGLHVSLGEGKRSSTVTIIRTGSFNHPKYGRFEVTRELIEGMVHNFDARTYGQDIFIDVAHEPNKGAAGEVKRLFVEGNRLRALVDWTEYGIDAIAKRGFRYLSADYWDDWEDNEEGRKHGPLLAGAGLVTRPHIKRLDPVQLSEPADGVNTYLHPELSKTLLKEAQQIMKKYLKQLREYLEGLKLSEPAIKSILSAYESAAKNLAEDDDALKSLMEQMQSAANELVKQLGESKPGDIKIEIAAPAPAAAGKTLTEDDIKRILAAEHEAHAARLDETETKRLANVKQFTDAVHAQEGFSDELKKQLCERVDDLITADMIETQIKALADNAIAMGNQMSAQAKLLDMGWPGPNGAVRVSLDDSNNVKQLQETVDRRLGLLDMSDSKRYAATGGKLLEENKKFAEKVLAQFDSERAPQLHAEHKMLAGGDGLVSDVAVPATWERTVIREALHRLIGLQFVNVGVENFATSYMIPYSYRDTSAAGRSNARKYEGQAVARAGVIQTAETAYNTPQKLAFEVSDELRYLTAARHLDWDAIAENQQNASRIIGEDTEHLIFNEILNASDEYSSTAVSNEDLELQADDTKNVFVLAQWPVVRPRSVYDLQGNQVGSTVNPIVVSYDSTALEEYDGTGTQAAGTYYSMDYNLGEIRLVDESGALQVPANGTAYTASYSYTTNAYKFSTDLGSALAEDHWNTFLYRFGLRKSIIEDDRYHMANFGTMSGTVANQIEQAKQFAANFRRPGTDLAADGNVGRVKDVPIFKSAAPGLYMGDQRIILGERGVTRFRMAKAWMLGELENQRDANGRFTGKKEAYGDQFVVCHTPTQLKAALTSIVLYSATARVARAE